MDDHTRKGTKHVYTFTSTFPMWRSYSSKINIQQDFQSLLNMSHCFQSKKMIPVYVCWTLKVTKWLWKTCKISVFDKKNKICVFGVINTVLVYKKGSKTKNIFLFLKNTTFQLSNALSIVFVSLKLVKIQQIQFSWAEPPKGAP